LIYKGEERLKQLENEVYDSMNLVVRPTLSFIEKDTGKFISGKMRMEQDLLVKFWFAPWGAWKSEVWEYLSNDLPFTADNMLLLMHTIDDKLRDRIVEINLQGLLE